ncbi:SDR family oxidoreductase [Methylobacterium sp. V23]|uniref:SDR family oxidoreductase n=1 Tax=Methylobacterium sp. V23 TaxID=2044878 RepID=UPI001FE0CA89|nr:SDR family oxidoreductase [Methylobacterium sp. V23]
MARFEKRVVVTGAVTNLTRSLALEPGDTGVRVNAVNPSLTLTDLTRSMKHDTGLMAMFADRIPMGRGAEPEGNRRRHRLPGKPRCPFPDRREPAGRRRVVRLERPTAPGLIPSRTPDVRRSAGPDAAFGGRSPGSDS